MVRLPQETGTGSLGLIVEQDGASLAVAVREEAAPQLPGAEKHGRQWNIEIGKANVLEEGALQTVEHPG